MFFPPIPDLDILLAISNFIYKNGKIMILAESDEKKNVKKKPISR